jgi:protein tyrosine/serine phosphatase
MDVTTADKTDASAIDREPRKSRRWWVIACVVIGVGIAGWVISDYAGTWKDRFVPRKFRVVEPGAIFASGQIDRRLIRGVLVDNKIQEIICLMGNDAKDVDSAFELKTAQELGIERLYFPLSGDGTGDIQQYAGAVAAMVACQKAGKPVLVHCSSGSQRTNGAIYFYRVLLEGRDAETAAQEMYRNGHDTKANPLLIPYLNQNIGEMARLLVQKGIIEKIPDPLPQIHHD